MKPAFRLLCSFSSHRLRTTSPPSHLILLSIHLLPPSLFVCIFQPHPFFSITKHFLRLVLSCLSPSLLHFSHFPISPLLSFPISPLLFSRSNLSFLFQLCLSFPISPLLSYPMDHFFSFPIIPILSFYFIPLLSFFINPHLFPCLYFPLFPVVIS